MTWIALDASLRHHRKIAALSEDAARWAWVVTLMEAKRQRPPGRFASESHLAYVLGDSLSPFVHEFVSARLLEKRRNGGLVVHDWPDYQRDPTNAARQARYRDRHRNVTDNGEVTPSRERPRMSLSSVPSPSSPGVVKGDAHLPVLAWLRVHGVQRIVGKTLNDLIEFAEKDGPDALIAAMEQLGPNLDAAQYVYGARNLLHPIPSSSRQHKPNSPHLADLQAATEVV